VPAAHGHGEAPGLVHAHDGRVGGLVGEEGADDPDGHADGAEQHEAVDVGEARPHRLCQ
jgi:hypothetical protein